MNIIFIQYTNRIRKRDFYNLTKINIFTKQESIDEPATFKILSRSHDEASQAVEGTKQEKTYPYDENSHHSGESSETFGL